MVIRRDIPYPVRQGDLLSVQITTAKVRPINLLILVATDQWNQCDGAPEK